MKILQNAVARAVYRLGFGPEGRKLVAGGSGGLDLWDLATGDHSHMPSPDVTNYVLFCECDPQGRWFYVSDSLGGRMIPWSGAGERRFPCPPGYGHLQSLAITANGARVLVNRTQLAQLECWATATDKFSPVWGWRSGQPVDPLEPPRELAPSWVFRAVALSGDGRLAAAVGSRTADPGPVVTLRDGHSGDLVRDLGPAGDFMSYRLAFVPDGKTLIGYDEKAVTLWDTATGSRIGQFRPGRAKLNGLAVHPSGQFLLTAGADQTARVWHLADLSQTRALKWMVGKLSSVAISPDGTLAAAGGEKGQVVVWDVD